MKRPAPTRTDRDRGADIPLIEMLLQRPDQPHIRQIAPGRYWVDLPADVFVSVDLGPTPPGKNLPQFTVRTWRNAYERSVGDE